MPKAKPFSITIVVERYERYGASEAVTRTYKGKDELTVLQKIAENHSYGRIDPDDLDEGEELTARYVWDQIESLNGDGCDYIAAYLTDAKPYKGPKKSKR